MPLSVVSEIWLRLICTDGEAPLSSDKVVEENAERASLSAE